jgi:hypothetical protein
MPQRQGTATFPVWLSESGNAIATTTHAAPQRSLHGQLDLTATGAAQQARETKNPGNSGSYRGEDGAGIGI